MLKTDLYSAIKSEDSEALNCDCTNAVFLTCNHGKLFHGRLENFVKLTSASICFVVNLY